MAREENLTFDSTLDKKPRIREFVRFKSFLTQYIDSSSRKIMEAPTTCIVDGLIVTSLSSQPLDFFIMIIRKENNNLNNHTLAYGQRLDAFKSVDWVENKVLYLEVGDIIEARSSDSSKQINCAVSYRELLG